MRLSLLVASGLFSVSLAAHATLTYNATPSTTTSPNGLTSPYSGVTTIDFNSSLTKPASFTGGTVVNGSSSGGYAAPSGDTSNFFAVGSAPNYTGTASFSAGAAYNYFGIYWGSIDAYNTISFFSNGINVGTVTGTQVPPANGSQTAANTNEFVNFYLSNGATYDSVVFSTSSANFELDNVTYGNVAVTPEPSSFVLLGTGLLGVAGMLKRRFV